MNETINGVSRALLERIRQRLIDKGEISDFGPELFQLLNNTPASLPAPFQARVQPWLLECFGPMIAGDREERNHRFLEEALELVQACGASASEAHQLVDYVYSRPVGDPAQEVGGVMVTLAALCLANGLDMHADGETELARIWTKVEQIRAKQAAKPSMSPLPGVYPERQQPTPAAIHIGDLDPTQRLNLARGEPAPSGLTWWAQGDANFYTLHKDRHWYAVIRMNGELSLADQEAFLNGICPQHSAVADGKARDV